MELYFLRHGLAVDPGQWEGDDFERPLTEEGQRRMKAEAKAIARLGLKPDYILTSPLKRALQTAQIVSDCLAAEGLIRKSALVEDKRLSSGFGMPELEAMMQTYSNTRAIMLVGHEPDFSKVIGQLIGNGRVVCKKGGLARVDLFDAPTLAGDLVWLIPPKLLDGML
jgi:phosphohistidine phosphatase